MVPVCDPFIIRLGTTLGGGSGPLNGMTVAVKDNYDIEGLATGNGCPEWLEDHPKAAQNADLVDALLRQGAVIVGKTHMDELAYSLMGVNARYGTPLNAAAPDRVPGGSSSGSAAATAAGLCDLGLGSDTGGSVRLPASFCGLWGWRVSHGSLPVGGLAPLAPSYDVPGFFARNRITIVRVGDALLPDNPTSLDGWRLWAPPEAWACAEPGSEAVLRPVLEKIAERAGGVLADPLPGPPIENWRSAFRVHQAREIWQALGPWVERRRPKFGPGVRERFAMAASLTDRDFKVAAGIRGRIRGAMDEAMQDRILVLPTAPGPAPRREADQHALEAFRNAALALLSIAGHCGLPQLTAPVASVCGAPIGLSLVGPRGSDRQLLALAGELGL